MTVGEWPEADLALSEASDGLDPEQAVPASELTEWLNATKSIKKNDRAEIVFNGVPLRRPKHALGGERIPERYQSGPRVRH